MLQYLPTELIISIATYSTPETKSTIAQTCQTCYRAVLPLLWNYLPLKTVENLHDVVDRLHRNDWVSFATKFVHDIALTSQLTHQYTLEDLQGLLGIIDTGYAYLREENRNESMSLLSSSPSSLCSSTSNTFATFISNLMLYFPHSSTISLDYYLVSPYLTADTTTNITSFKGEIDLVHYRPGQTKCLHQLLISFPELTKLVIRSLSSPSFKLLLQSKPTLETLTIHWKYSPDSDYVESLSQMAADTGEWECKILVALSNSPGIRFSCKTK
ncbi:uncharacterized protein BX664DRAFT_331714 [Halteromyces radiatus]|uniref:uncharacterized protein n=1 Tax=Halteromyces radiatus TaxID=101107 RepID=UPI00221EC650|nr:uncharacterized protein BX664DRAFT_331714 [Halteromyces radiatus]KAI8088914.1 hypothetical protein BX664DRAFT_331714 [Halteromyces radiatus]